MNWFSHLIFETYVSRGVFWPRPNWTNPKSWRASIWVLTQSYWAMSRKIWISFLRKFPSSSPWSRTSRRNRFELSTAKRKYCGKGLNLGIKSLSHQLKTSVPCSLFFSFFWMSTTFKFPLSRSKLLAQLRCFENTAPFYLFRLTFKVLQSDSTQLRDAGMLKNLSYYYRLQLQDKSLFISRVNSEIRFFFSRKIYPWLPLVLIATSLRTNDKVKTPPKPINWCLTPFLFRIYDTTHERLEETYRDSLISMWEIMLLNCELFYAKWLG